MCLLVASMWPSLQARADLPRESMLFGADFDNLGLSLGYDNLSRKVQFKNNPADEDLLQADQGYILLTYDLCPWLDVNAGIGQSQIKPTSTTSSDNSSDGKALWTVGIHANIWQGDIYEPEYFMSRCKLHSSFGFWSNESSVDGYDLDWTETKQKRLTALSSLRAQSSLSLPLTAPLL